MSYEAAISSPFPETEQAEKPWTLEDANELVFWYNPGSWRTVGRAAAFGDVAIAANKYGKTVSIAETSPHLDANIESVQSQLPKGALAVFYAGDGGAGEMLRAMYEAGLDNPALILPGGDKCDMAHQLFSRRLLRRPDKALESARVATIYPVVVTLTPEDEPPETNLFFTYGSAGGTGNVMARVNSKERREERASQSPIGAFITQQQLALQEVLQTEPFLLQDGDNTTPTLEFMVAAGRMAGIFHPRGDMLRGEFRYKQVRSLLGAAGLAGGLLLGLPIGKLLTAGKSLSFDIIPNNRTFVQFDGQDKQITIPTNVHWQVAERGVQVLTDRKSR